MYVLRSYQILPESRDVVDINMDRTLELFSCKVHRFRIADSFNIWGRKSSDSVIQPKFFHKTEKLLEPLFKTRSNLDIDWLNIDRDGSMEQ